MLNGVYLDVSGAVCVSTNDLHISVQTVRTQRAEVHFGIEIRCIYWNQ